MTNEHEEEHNELLMRTGRCSWCGETLDETAPPCSSRDCQQPECTYPLTIAGAPAPPMCCTHRDHFMAYLASTVPADEGRTGLARYRLDHERHHGKVPA
jgi:hypothetical protein